MMWMSMIKMITDAFVAVAGDSGGDWLVDVDRLLLLLHINPDQGYC